MPTPARARRPRTCRRPCCGTAGWASSRARRTGRPSRRCRSRPRRRMCRRAVRQPGLPRHVGERAVAVVAQQELRIAISQPPRWMKRSIRRRCRSRPGWRSARRAARASPASRGTSSKVPSGTDRRTGDARRHALRVPAEQHERKGSAASAPRGWRARDRRASRTRRTPPRRRRGRGGGHHRAPGTGSGRSWSSPGSCRSRPGAWRRCRPLRRTGSTASPDPGSRPHGPRASRAAVKWRRAVTMSPWADATAPR